MTIFLVGIGLLYAGITHDAPPIFLAVVLVPSVLAAMMVIRNDPAWTRFDALGWAFSNSQTDGCYRWSDIREVEFESWSDSTDVIITMISGRRVSIPNMGRPPVARIKEELDRRRIIWRRK